MNNLIDNIIDELENEGVKLLQPVESNIYHHATYEDADREKIKKALLKAFEKSLGD